MREKIRTKFRDSYTTVVKKPINVLHLLGAASPEGRGIAKIVAELPRNLDPQYRVHAWFLESDGPLVEELRDSGASAHWIDWKNGSRGPLGAFRFWRQLRSEDFSLVHQHWGARSIRHLIRATTGAKIIVHAHGQLLSTVDRVDNLPGLRGADAIIAVSKSIADQMSDRRVHVVYSGIRSSDQTAQTTLRSRKSITIGTACRLIEAKGVQDLIAAFSRLMEEFPDVRLKVAGDGTHKDFLVRAAREQNVSQKVEFVGWVDNLRPVLRTWDIFAFPSYDEGLPVAILEAMSEGLPVVATMVGGIPELVEHERTGFLVSPGDVNALWTALRRLVIDCQLRGQMGDQGRRRAETRFSVRQMVAGIESIYASLLSCQ
jgi:glycosyltransferase involved in cell wall biosynthesis